MSEVPPYALGREHGHHGPTLLQSERKQGFSADPFYGRARCSHMLGSFTT